MRGPGEKPLANAPVRGFERGSASGSAYAFTAYAFTRTDLAGIDFTRTDLIRIDLAGIAEDALDDVHRTVRRP